MVTNNLVRRQTVCTENRSQICTMIICHVMSCHVMSCHHPRVQINEKKIKNLSPNTLRPTALEFIQTKASIIYLFNSQNSCGLSYNWLLVSDV